MNIYIPIEMKVRELEGRSLLAFAAAERGHTVILGDKGDTRTLARDGVLPPGIIHNKSLTPSESTIEMMDRFSQHGHLISAQDEESGLLDESFDKFARIRFSDDSVSRADRVLAWGDHDARSLKALFHTSSDKIVATGSPRVDFWRPDLATYYKLNGENGEPGNRPFILVASNFSSLLDQNRIWNRIARQREAGYFDRDPEREYHVYNNAAYQLQLVYKFVKAIRALSVALPDVDILLRPHPVESVNAWKKLIGDYPNLYVHRKGSISAWIRKASLLVHNGCTSALEAAVSGLPRIAYRPLPSELEREIPNRISYQAFAYDELEDMISDHLKGRNLKGSEEVEKRTEEVLSARFANLNGKLGADRIVDVWEEAAGSFNFGQAGPEELIRAKPAEKNRFMQKAKQTLAAARSTLLKSGESSSGNGNLLDSSHKFPSFEEAELQQLKKALQQTLDRFHDVEYRRFGERSWILFNKNM